MGIGIFVPINASLYLTKAVYDPDLDGHVEKLIVELVASDDLLKSVNDDETNNTETPTKLAEITVPNGIGSSTLRVKFSVRDEHAVTSYGRAQVYKNGVAVGTLQSSPNDDTWALKTEDLADSWEAGDLIQLYAYVSATPQVVHIKEFRVYGVKNALHIVDANTW